MAVNKSIKFWSLILITNKTHDEYYKDLDNIFRHYNKAGFVISRIHCDGKYCSMMDKVPNKLKANMNYVNAHVHILEVEQNNRTIKERVHCTFQRLPFKKIPKVMIQYLVMVQTDHLNLFPVKGGISHYYSPWVILGGTLLDYNKHCQVSFGTYIQANHETRVTNSQVAWTINCIYLWPIKNLQCKMDLNSGKVITLHVIRWQRYPSPRWLFKLLQL